MPEVYIIRYGAGNNNSFPTKLQKSLFVTIMKRVFYCVMKQLIR